MITLISLMVCMLTVTEYTPLPMSEQLFWSRVGWLQQAMIRAENFEFRLLWFNKLQELMKLQP